METEYDISPTRRSGIIKVDFKDFESRRTRLSNGKLLYVLATDAIYFKLNVYNLPYFVRVKMKDGRNKTFRYMHKNRARTPIYKTIDGDVIKIRNVSYS